MYTEVCNLKWAFSQQLACLTIARQLYINSHHPSLFVKRNLSSGFFELSGLASLESRLKSYFLQYTEITWTGFADGFYKNCTVLNCLDPFAVLGLKVMTANTRKLWPYIYDVHLVKVFAKFLFCFQNVFHYNQNLIMFLML